MVADAIIFVVANDVAVLRGGRAGEQALGKEKRRGAESGAMAMPAGGRALVIAPSGSVDNPERYTYGAMPNLCRMHKERGYPPYPAAGDDDGDAPAGLRSEKKRTELLNFAAFFNLVVQFLQRWRTSQWRRSRYVGRALFS